MIMPVLTTHIKIFFGLVLLLSMSTLAEDESLQGTELWKQQEIRIVVMGDSLSAAYYIPLESGWVNLLQDRFAEQELSIKVINSSISGATTAAGLQTLPVALKQYKPHIVLLEMGGNDGLQGKPVDLIKRNLENMIQQSQDHDAEVVLIGMRLPPNLGSRYTEPFFQQYAELAEKYQLAYVPFLLEGVAGNSELMQQDGIHPTAEAQPLILQNVWPVIQRVLQEKFKLKISTG